MPLRPVTLRRHLSMALPFVYVRAALSRIGANAGLTHITASRFAADYVTNLCASWLSGRRRRPERQTGNHLMSVRCRLCRRALLMSSAGARPAYVKPRRVFPRCRRQIPCAGRTFTTSGQSTGNRIEGRASVTRKWSIRPWVRRRHQAAGRESVGHEIGGRNCAAGKTSNEHPGGGKINGAGRKSIRHSISGRIYAAGRKSIG